MMHQHIKDLQINDACPTLLCVPVHALCVKNCVASGLVNGEFVHPWAPRRLSHYPPTPNNGQLEVIA